MKYMGTLCWTICYKLDCAIPSSVEIIRGNVFASVLVADAILIAIFIRNEFVTLFCSDAMKRDEREKKS